MKNKLPLPVMLACLFASVPVAAATWQRVTCDGGASLTGTSGTWVKATIGPPFSVDAPTGKANYMGAIKGGKLYKAGPALPETILSNQFSQTVFTQLSSVSTKTPVKIYSFGDTYSWDTYVLFSDGSVLKSFGEQFDTLPNTSMTGTAVDVAYSNSFMGSKPLVVTSTGELWAYAAAFPSTTNEYGWAANSSNGTVSGWKKSTIGALVTRVWCEQALSKELTCMKSAVCFATSTTGDLWAWGNNSTGIIGATDATVSKTITTGTCTGTFNFDITLNPRKIMTGANIKGVSGDTGNSGNEIIGYSTTKVYDLLDKADITVNFPSLPASDISDSGYYMGVNNSEYRVMLNTATGRAYSTLTASPYSSGSLAGIYPASYTRNSAGYAIGVRTSDNVPVARPFDASYTGGWIPLQECTRTP